MQKEQLKNALQKRIVGLVAQIDKSTAEHQIGALWQQAAEKGHLPTDGSPAYGVYFDYQDKLANRYSLLVGRASDEELAGAQCEVLLPAGNYAVFRDEGVIPQVARELWRCIWKSGGSKSERAWKVDYETYEGGAAHCKVAVHLGLKDRG